MLGFKKTYLLPFKFEIPNYAHDFLAKQSLIKPLFKYIKRFLYISLKRQRQLEVSKILDKHQNILWLNFSAPSLGDSLMDLSSRILLSDRKIDLLTDKKNVLLYTHDTIFSSAYSRIDDVIKNSYDLVIVDSYSTRSIKIKNQSMPSTPFIGMYGYYNGPEVNRVLYSFHRINSLLGYIKSESEINRMAKSSISISIQDQAIIKKLTLSEEYITIALGGEWHYRSYKNWPQLIEKLLIENSKLNIVLIGSNNADRISKKILDRFSSYNILNCVDKFTFNQTAEIIKKAKLLICCDGGLMHAANAVGTKIIPLFARLEAEMQLTQSCESYSLYDPVDVSNILVEDIMRKYLEAISLDHNDLQAE
jgi:heptosyltransferase-2